MQVSNLNDVKVYNLSVGKSLPEWLTDRKKRDLQKKDLDLKRRIELIQDFEMPSVSNCVQVTPDQNYILATGVYKPRVRCYDVNQVSMKFERCFDAQVVKMCVLSDDFSKIVFLQDDRYLEFHHKYGKHYRTRIPRNGRDLSYHHGSCDLYIVGASREIYRLNLELGKFMNSIQTTAQEIMCCQISDAHNLFTYGTKDGRVECIDPRTRSIVGSVDCAAAIGADGSTSVASIPEIVSLKYKDPLHFAAGTSTGQILVFDIRSPKPLLVKDHHYELPIKSIEFNHSENLVMSMDTRIVKIWDYDTGKPFTSIEPEGTRLNDLAVFPDTGLFMIANEAPKLLSYYVPAIGPAPRWCAFLDNLTEELEETDTPAVYEDYKFVTRGELDRLSLTHLIGSDMLRAYMHGYFMDVRLYHKAAAITDPFVYDDYRKQRIQETIESKRSNRVQSKKNVSKVNVKLAEELMLESQSKSKKKTADVLTDDRFASLFTDPNFQVETTSEAYRLLTPVVSKLMKPADSDQALLKDNFTEVPVDATSEGQLRDDRDDDESSSDDDDVELERQMREQHRIIKMEKRQAAATAAVQPAALPSTRSSKLYEIKGLSELDSSSTNKKAIRQQKKVSLGERVRGNEKKGLFEESGNLGSKEVSFTTQKEKRSQARKQEEKEHRLERKKIRRSAHEITKKTKPPGWRPGM